MTEIATILTDAAALVRRGWTQGVLARDAKGESTFYLDRTACQWCAAGAIGWAAGADRAAADRATGVLATALRGPAYSYDSAGVADILDAVGQWNDADGQTAEKVARALERAARRAEAHEVDEKGNLVVSAKR